MVLGITLDSSVAQSMLSSPTERNRPILTGIIRPWKAGVVLGFVALLIYVNSILELDDKSEFLKELEEKQRREKELSEKGKEGG